MAATIASLRKAKEDAEQVNRRVVATVELLRSKGDMDEHSEVYFENRLAYLDQKAAKAAADLEASLKEHGLVVPQDWLKFTRKAKAMAEKRKAAQLELDALGNKVEEARDKVAHFAAMQLENEAVAKRL